MNRLKSIVVGFDFSRCAASAVAQAIRIARRNHADLTVVHAVDPLVVHDLARANAMSVAETTSDTIASATHALVQAVKAIDPDIEFETHVEVSSSIRVLVSVVKSTRADLLVLGVYGVSGPGRGAGTLATKCVRKAPVRVLLVHERHESAYRRIVACIDFSETSEAAAAQAARIAAADKAELFLLHVFHGPWHRLHYRAPSSESSPDFQRQYTAALTAQLDSLREPLARQTPDLSMTTAVVDHVSHGDAIIEFATANDADLIVLGTEGRTMLRYMILGSTAERVLRELTSSVLVIKPKSLMLTEE
ncbi:MAG: universal stress protein [Phycisphaerales bacterium]|nr:universal stress protein [Phycisphaerae bacterium]NNF42168.1 universal stress protein [Phycisphaerales bacterium]NNM27866.1 universal stress protein [Phycisphaerales bacterium]